MYLYIRAVPAIILNDAGRTPTVRHLKLPRPFRGGLRGEAAGYPIWGSSVCVQLLEREPRSDGLIAAGVVKAYHLRLTHPRRGVLLQKVFVNAQEAVRGQTAGCRFSSIPEPPHIRPRFHHPFAIPLR